MSIIAILLFSWIFAPGYVPYGFDASGNYIGSASAVSRPHLKK